VHETNAMTRSHAIRRLLRLALLSLAVGAIGPGSASAGWLGFRNDTKAPILVQGMSIVNKTLRAGKVHTLQPGQVSWDFIIAPGNKLVIIADAKQPTRILYRDTVPFMGKDLFYSIKPEAPAKNNAKAVPLTKVQIQQIPPPSPPPGIRGQ
jgi:hypothetical protein